MLEELLPDRLPGMTGPESAFDGWKHDPNEAGLGGGMQIPCHGAQCGFCLFDHGGANKNQHEPTRANREIHASTIILCPRQHLLTQANKSQHFRRAATRFVRHKNSIFQPNSGYWNIEECVTGGAGNELQITLAKLTYTVAYISTMVTHSCHSGEEVRRCLYEVLGSPRI